MSARKSAHAYLEHAYSRPPRVGRGQPRCPWVGGQNGHMSRGRCRPRNTIQQQTETCPESREPVEAA